MTMSDALNNPYIQTVFDSPFGPFHKPYEQSNSAPIIKTPVTVKAKKIKEDKKSKAIEYKTIIHFEHTNCDPLSIFEGFDLKVNEHLQNGWELYGEAIRYNIGLYLLITQPMIRR